MSCMWTNYLCYNKREDDFGSLWEYNDYLEEVGEMKGRDVAIEERIKKYEKHNFEQIVNARARNAEEIAADLAASKGPVHFENMDETTVKASGYEGGEMQYVPVVPV